MASFFVSQFWLFFSQFIRKVKITVKSEFRDKLAIFNREVGYKTEIHICEKKNHNCDKKTIKTTTIIARFKLRIQRKKVKIARKSQNLGVYLVFFEYMLRILILYLTNTRKSLKWDLNKISKATFSFTILFYYFNSMTENGFIAWKPFECLHNVERKTCEFQLNPN